MKEAKWLLTFFISIIGLSISLYNLFKPTARPQLIQPIQITISDSILKDKNSSDVEKNAGDINKKDSATTN